MFLEDPQVRVAEARRVIKEITNSMRQFSSDTLVVVSFHRTPPSAYYQMLFPHFDKRIQIANGESNGSFLVEVNDSKKDGCRIIQLQRQDLEIIPQR